MKRVYPFFVLSSAMFGCEHGPLILADSPSQMEPQRSTQVEVDRGGVHIESNVERNRGPNEYNASVNHEPVFRDKDLIGLEVYGPTNERLGKVEDLVIDPARGASATRSCLLVGSWAWAISTLQYPGMT